VAVEFDPQKVLIDWKDASGFTIADAQTGVAVFGATGSGKTSGPGADRAPPRGVGAVS